jgi:hypothetical protein
VLRQALAGMLWSKQFFFFDVDMWLREHGIDPMRPPTRPVRNREWFHMISDHVISMPDKWEYPWYAAWDLAFHTIALATVDIDFAKQQLDLLLVDGTAWMALYAHNMIEIAVELSGREPAYEELATNFLLQFGLIARAMNGIDPDGMWDEEDGFYYDVLRLPDGRATGSRSARWSVCCRFVLLRFQSAGSGSGSPHYRRTCMSA